MQDLLQFIEILKSNWYLKWPNLQLRKNNPTHIWITFFLKEFQRWKRHNCASMLLLQCFLYMSIVFEAMERLERMARSVRDPSKTVLSTANPNTAHKRRIEQNTLDGNAAFLVTMLDVLSCLETLNMNWFLERPDLLLRKHKFETKINRLFVQAF